jgi:hypothetical protein
MNAITQATGRAMSQPGAGGPMAVPEPDRKKPGTGAGLEKFGRGCLKGTC